MSTVTPNLGLFKYDTTNVTDLASAFNINTALNNNWDKIDEAISNSGGSRNIGEIVSSTIPLTDAGLHLLDGSLINGSGIYSDFVDYIARLDLTANYFCTESEWQASVTQYGVCGKFVYDSVNNTVRLPKVTGIIEGTTDVNALGDLVEAGLPNIDGGRVAAESGGPFDYSYNQVIITYQGSTDHTLRAYKFDASCSNPIYGNSSTVQPQTIKAFYYIVIANSTKTDIEVDIDEVATDLNGKVNISDLAEVQCVVETYQNGTSWYRVYSDGWCEQGGRFNANNTDTTASYTVNLLKSYKDTNYSIVTCGYSNHADQYKNGVSPYSFTTNSFIIQTYTNDALQPIVWQASGYMAV